MLHNRGADPGRSVLVVDDDPSIRTLLVDFLRAEGFTPLAARTGWEALELSAQAVDAILLDLALPGLSGVDVLHRLKSDRSTRDVPVVVVSAYPWALEAGGARQAAEVVWKPFELDELRAAIGRVIPA